MLVDVANAQLMMLEDGHAVDTMKVIVGKPEFPTPLLAGHDPVRDLQSLLAHPAGRREAEGRADRAQARGHIPQGRALPDGGGVRRRQGSSRSIPKASTGRPSRRAPSKPTSASSPAPRT